MPQYKNPFPTVDLIIEIKGEDDRPGFVLIKRKNPPYGWALPGGFVDYGETLEQAAVREAREETSLDVDLVGQFHTYSDPDRDPRFHTISTIFIARAKGRPRAQDDAAEIGIFNEGNMPRPLAFDHEKILTDYFRSKKSENETKPKIDKNTKLKEVCRVMGPVEAEVIKSFLENNGIICLMKGTWVQSTGPISADGLGEVRILVSEADFDVAKELLEKRPSSENE